MDHPWFFYPGASAVFVRPGGGSLYPFVSGGIFAGLYGETRIEQLVGKYHCNKLGHASNADIHEKPADTTYN